MMEDTHERFIVVPNKPVDCNCYVEAIEHPGDFDLFEIHEDEFWRIFDSGFLAAINGEYHLMLDDFEGGNISENLDFVLKEAERVKDECPKVYEAAKAAVDYGTGISFEL